MHLTRRATLAAPLLGLTAPARAQPVFPSRPVRIIVPYTPGGVSDITARLIAEPLAAAWEQPVAVENRPGADGVIGSEALARATPDGHTLMLASVSHPVNAAFYRLPYDTLADFSFITQTTTTPLVLCVGRAFPAADVAGLVAQAKAHPGLTFAGTGGVVRLAPVLFAERAGIELSYVFYRGSTAAHPDLMAGRVDLMFDTVPAALPHIQSGALRALATTGAARAAQLPEVPTLSEAFMPGFEATTWGMLIAPARLPEAVLARIAADAAAALHRPEVLERHRVLGAAVVTSTPAAARAFVVAELAKWGEAASRAGIHPG